MNKQHPFDLLNMSRVRFWVQISTLILLLYGGHMALNIGDRLPTFACVFTDEHRGGSCYLMGFQHQMATPFNQWLTGRGIGILVGFLTFIGFFILLNKAWCGFVCPLGTLQDGLTRCRQAFKIRGSQYGETTFARLSTIKYLLLGLLILLPMGIGNALFTLPPLNHDFEIPYCMICPARTLLPLFSGDFSQLNIDFSSHMKLVLSALGMVVTGLFLAGSWIKTRFFCLFCPMAAFQYLFSRIGLLRLQKQGGQCTRCGNCARACEMGIQAIADDIESKNILKDDCTLCLKCIEVCPEENCLQASWGPILLYRASAAGFFKRQGGTSDDAN